MSDSCPFCAEQIAEDIEKCPHCGERLIDDPNAPVGRSSKTTVVVVIAILLGVAMVCVVLGALVAIPSHMPARKMGNEVAAIGALKTMGNAQALFREADKEQDGNVDYADSLKELSDTQLIAAELDARFQSPSQRPGSRNRASPSLSRPGYRSGAIRRLSARNIAACRASWAMSSCSSFVNGA